MTLPNEDDTGTTRRHQHLEEQSHGTHSKPSIGNKGGRLPDISTMIKVHLCCIHNPKKHQGKNLNAILSTVNDLLIAFSVIPKSSLNLFNYLMFNLH